MIERSLDALEFPFDESRRTDANYCQRVLEKAAA